MLDKCANPECHEKLVYLRSGLMYSVDASGGKNTDIPIRFFWLCEACSAKHKLGCNGEGELKLVPLNTPDLACRAGCSKVRVQRVAKQTSVHTPSPLVVLNR